MATKLASRGPIRLRRDDEAIDEASVPSSPEPSPGSDSGSEPDSNESDSASESSGNNASPAEEDAQDLDDFEDEESGEALNEISFGMLAEAQEKYAPKSRKRKLPGEFNESNPLEERDRSERAHQFREDERQNTKHQRQSKHAPAISSSRQQVSRKREVFEPSPAIKSRDPRFDPTIMSSNYSNNAVEKANKNYAFLTSYQAAEILDLKGQIKKAKDPAMAAELKRKVMSVEAKIRSAEARQRESKIVKEHNQKEREAIRSGQKATPYYLKPGEIKKKAEEERVAGMGKRARDKAEMRKKKREKSKDARSMPRVRREG